MHNGGILNWLGQVYSCHRHLGSFEPAAQNSNMYMYGIPIRRVIILGSELNFEWSICNYYDCSEGCFGEAKLCCRRFTVPPAQCLLWAAWEEWSVACLMFCATQSQSKLSYKKRYLLYIWKLLLRCYVRTVACIVCVGSKPWYGFNSVGNIWLGHP